MNHPSNNLIPRLSPKKASSAKGDLEGVILYQSTKDGCLYFIDQKGVHRGLREKGTVDVAETILTVTQPSHGFTLPTHGFIPVHKGGSLWVTADTSSSDKIHEAFIIEVVDSDTFKVQQAGFLTVPGHNLVVGQYYYSTSVGGVELEPDNSIDDVLCFVISNLTLMLIDNRPQISSQAFSLEEQSYDTVSLLFDGSPFYLNFQYSNHSVLLTKSALLSFLNGVVGENYKVKITQGALAPKVITFGPNVKTPGGSGITLSTGVGEIDILDVYYDGTTFFVKLFESDFQ